MNHSKYHLHKIKTLDLILSSIVIYSIKLCIIKNFLFTNNFFLYTKRIHKNEHKIFSQQEKHEYVNWEIFESVDATNILITKEENNSRLTINKLI